MTYPLCFSEAFFWGDDAVARKELPKNNRPTSVYQALRILSETAWAALARDCFGVPPEYLDIETVMARIVETNTCRNLDSPIEVWIDQEGFHTVRVW